MRGLGDLNRGGGGGAGAGQGGGPMGGQDCSTCIKDSWNSLPIWSKAVFIVSVTLYMLSWLSDYVNYYIMCYPSLIIYNYEGKYPS